VKRWRWQCSQKSRDRARKQDSERFLLKTSDKALTSSKVTQNSGSVSHSTTELGCGTHLTVNWLRNVKSDHVSEHGHEGGRARKGVQLYGRKISRRRRNPSATYPYRPPVRPTPSDDTPFVVEGSHELPAGNTWLSHGTWILKNG
jgi:hypothetical protein